MNADYNPNQIVDNLESEVDNVPDSLEAIVRRAAQTMLQAALEAEVAEFLGRSRGERGRNEGEDFRGYRNGFLPARTITTASGGITVRQPRVSNVPAAHERFESKVIEPYKRRTKALNELFPKLFVEGLATRDARAGIAFAFGRRRSAFTGNRVAP